MPHIYTHYYTFTDDRMNVSQAAEVVFFLSNTKSNILNLLKIVTFMVDIVLQMDLFLLF